MPECDCENLITRLCRKGKLELLQYFLNSSKPNIDFQKILNRLTAAELSSFKMSPILDYLVSQSFIQVESVFKNRSTSEVLLAACKKSCNSLIKALLESNLAFKINEEDKKTNNTSLHYAIWHQRNDFTDLHSACGRGDENEVSRLIYNKGVVINVQDNEGNTPLHIACKKIHSDIAVFLMMSNADETITNDKTKTPKDICKSLTLKLKLDRHQL